MARNGKTRLRAAAPIATLTAILLLVSGAWSQGKYKTLHEFRGGTSGSAPWANLTFDRAGNLYGATQMGGAFCTPGVCGLIFKLAPNTDGSWTESILYNFCSAANCTDGREVTAGLIFDQEGNLYGETGAGGSSDSGVVFKLAPNPNGSWTESVLYNFCSLANCADGRAGGGGLIFDQAGNLYGTTSLGGGGSCPDGCGVVFQLTPNVDGSWKENVLHSFSGGTDGAGPQSGLTLDQAGNLYGTTLGGGSSTPCVFAVGCGVVFKLTPGGREEILHRFTLKGGVNPFATLIIDDSGNLYGTTEAGGNLSLCGSGCGVVFELTSGPNGGWREKVVHYFKGGTGDEPTGELAFDGAGNLYGTTNIRWLQEAVSILRLRRRIQASAGLGGRLERNGASLLRERT